MPTLGFKTEIKSGLLKGWKTNFPEKILAGDKKHTIRLNPKRKYEVGSKLYLATGVRTSNYNCFAERLVVKTERITIYNYNAYHPEIMGNNKAYLYDGGYLTIRAGKHHDYLTCSEMEQLAKDDGFESLEQFLQWFDIKKGGHTMGMIIFW